MALSTKSLDAGVFDFSPDAIVVADGDRVIRRVNPAFVMLFGYAEDELRGQPTRVLYADPADFERMGKRRRQEDPRNPPAQFQIRFRRKDGTTFHSATTTKLIFRGDGVCRGHIAIIRDISDRVKRDELLRSVITLSGNPGADTGEVASDFLQACCDYFGLESGLVTEIDGDRLTARHVFDRGGHYEAGDRFDIDGTFCGSVLRSETVVSHDQSSVPWHADDPDDNKDGALVTYIGVPRRVGGKAVGTLCFLGHWPRYQPFSKEDRTQLRFLADWLDGFLEQRESRSRYRLLVETTNVIPWEMDIATWQFTYVGPQVSSLLGYTDQQWCAEGFWNNTVHPDDREAALAFCQAAAARGEDHDFEYRMIAADGRVVWMRDVVTVVPEGAKPAKLRGILIDITGSKETETTLEAKNAELGRLSEQLSQSARDFQRLYRETPAMLHSVDPEGRLVEVNDYWLRKMGYDSRDEVIGRPVFEFHPPGQQDMAKRCIAEFWRTGEPVRNRSYDFVCKDGGTFEVELSVIVAKPKGDSQAHSLAVSFDVTERNRARRALERNAQTFQRLYRETPAMLHSTDSTGRLIEVSDRWLEKMGYRRREEVLGRPVTDFFTPDSHDDVAREISAFWRSGKAVWNAPRSVVRKDGSVFQAELSAIVETPVGETHGRSLAVIIDVTERDRALRQLKEKNAELEKLGEELTRTAQRFEKLYRETPAMLYSIDTEGRLVEVSDHWLQKLGYGSRDEVLGRHIGEFHSPEYREHSAERVAEFWGSGKSFWNRHIEFMRKDGTVFEADLSATITTPEAGAATGQSLSVVFDVTDRNRAKREIEIKNIELQRLNEELDTFASVASHDLQEPLRKIRKFSEILEEDHSGRLEEEGVYALGVMRRAASRMQTLISDLLAYARTANAAVAAEIVDLDAVVAHVIEDLSLATSNAGATVTFAGLPAVPGDKGQVMQLFQNLIGNAVKYRDPSRPCAVSVTAEKCDARRAWLVSVSDNGIGIDPRLADEIFLPFRRLHPRSVSGGSGLGLTICGRIAERHGWSVTVDGRPGEGSTFTVEIPVAI